MRQLPPEAPQEVRNTILLALKQEEFSLYKDAERYLKLKGFDPMKFIEEDLVCYLEEGWRLYFLQGPGIKGLKYQCCLDYEDDLVIHIKLSPREYDQTFSINIGCHSHNTGYPPLPA